MKIGKMVLFTGVLLLVITNQFSSQNREARKPNINEPAVYQWHQTIAATPDALIKDLYKVHGQKNSRILSDQSRKLLDKYFDRNLADLIWKDLTTHRNEYGVIDFDIFYNTQDPLIKNVSVGQPKFNGGKAAVSVSFYNSGAREIVNYTLVRQNGEWKISNIRYRNGKTLLKYFEEGI